MFQTYREKLMFNAMTALRILRQTYPTLPALVTEDHLNRILFQVTRNLCKFADIECDEAEVYKIFKDIQEFAEHVRVKTNGNKLMGIDVNAILERVEIPDVLRR